jgi:hypothetical protein
MYGLPVPQCIQLGEELNRPQVSGQAGGGSGRDGD